jgi:hypothetical protein
MIENARLASCDTRLTQRLESAAREKPTVRSSACCQHSCAQAPRSLSIAYARSWNRSTHGTAEYVRLGGADVRRSGSCWSGSAYAALVKEHISLGFNRDR